MRPEDLLARLEAGYAYDPMYGQLCNERDQLKAENTKLRKLVDYMTPIAWYAASERERDRMRELGVEVDR